MEEGRAASQKKGFWDLSTGEVIKFGILRCGDGWKSWGGKSRSQLGIRLEA